MDAEDIQREKDEQEWLNPGNWRYGIFYFSPQDSRAWVPKRSMFGRRRFGGTPNLARKEARGYLMLMVGGLVLVLLLIAALRQAGVLG